MMKTQLLSKPKTLIALLLILPMFTFLSSCGDDTPEEMEEMMEGTDECTPYSATLAGNTITTTWVDPNQEEIYADEIVIPSDIGGGYVKVTLSANDSTFVPTMEIDVESTFDPQYIIGGNAFSSDNRNTREAYFSVHPDQEYSVRARLTPVINLPVSNLPTTTTLEWEFFSRIDCWEDNDVKEDSKEIFLGDINEAYAIAGHINDQITTLDPQIRDWYKITIDATTRLQLEIFDQPTDIRIKSEFQVLNSDVSIASDLEYTGQFTLESAGQASTNTTTDALEPGTYYISIYPDYLANGRVANYDYSPVPDHFDNTYKFKITSL